MLKGEAAFFNRADNLIPLLTAYEDFAWQLRGEPGQVASKDDGSPSATFISDNYFYYTQGVISAMVTVLEAVGHDFKGLTSRWADADLNHAISSCEHALEVDPIVVFNNAPSSLFANHRANLVAPVSHARFFLSVLIKTLSGLMAL